MEQTTTTSRPTIATTVSPEALPLIWDDERDVPFFRITAELFSHDFVYGAGVLLASYDEDE